MNEAAAQLLGEHDSPPTARSAKARPAIRALRQVHWVRGDDGTLEATVKADAFCHDMVRSLVGAMLRR